MANKSSRVKCIRKLLSFDTHYKTEKENINAYFSAGKMDKRQERQPESAKKEKENWECESCIMPKTTTMGKLNT